MPMKLPAVLSSLSLALLLAAAGPRAHADIYGYVDDNGTAHFAAEKVDERYQLFFRNGQSFDTADGLRVLPKGRLGRGSSGAVAGGSPPPASQALLALFEKSPSYKVAKSALQEASRRHAIDYELLQALVATESGFDAGAISPKGAIGLMQVMPATAARYGLQGDRRRTAEAKLHDPRLNIATGSRYLRDLIHMFDGSLELALAAYNAGEGAVQRAGNRIPNYRETQNYVKTVLQLYAYLKPGATSVARGGGKVPGRVRMELAGAGTGDDASPAADRPAALRLDTTRPRRAPAP